MGKGSRQDKDNARNRRQRQLSPEQEAPLHPHSDMLLSPPTHLPTPLPEEERLALSMRQHSQGVELDDDDNTSDLVSSRLIDFDHESTMGSPHQPLVSFSDDHNTTESTPIDMDHEQQPEGDDGEDMESTYRVAYRSPPFRVADLPPDSPPQQSPPPLPIPPRVPRHEIAAEVTHTGATAGFVGVGGIAEDTPLDSNSGHSREPNFNLTRSPTLRSPISPVYSSTASSPYPQSRYGHSRTPSSPSHNLAYSTASSTSGSALESLTRTIRGYVPSPGAILPSQSSAPRGLGSNLFGNTYSDSQTTPRRVVSQPQEFEREYERYDEDDDGYSYGGNGGHGPSLSRLQPPQEILPQQLQRQRSMPQGVYTPVTHHPQPVHLPMNVHALSSGHPVAVSSGPPNSTTRRSGLAMLRATEHGGSTTHHRSGRNHNSDVPSKDPVSFARWDSLMDRRLLILGYAFGFQIWDCTNLSLVDEVLNLNYEMSAPEGKGEGWRSDGGTLLNVVYAAVLPPPSRQATVQCGEDPLEAFRPIIGILLESSDPDEREQEPQATFILYSVRDGQHQLVKRLVFNGLPSTFSSNEHFIVLSTIMPSTLHILSSTTFDTLHTISSASIEPFTPPAFISSSSPGSALQPSALSITTISNAISSASIKSVSLVGNPLEGLSGGGEGVIGRGEEDGGVESPAPAPRPIFALSGRLLAYASPSPSDFASQSSRSATGGGNRRLSSSSTNSGSGHSVPGSNTSASASSSPFGSLGGLGKITQADVGHAAMKVGESVFSGVKFLGGMAFEAAKNKVSGGSPGSSGGLNVVGGSPGSGSRFVSRSAPESHTSVEEEATKRLRDRERRHSNSSSPVPSPSASGVTSHPTTVAPFTRHAAERGHYVSVVDLQPLLSYGQPLSKKGGPKTSKTTLVDTFLASRSQSVSMLQFSPDGMGLGVGLRDGRNFKVFQIRPTPGVLLSSLSASSTVSQGTSSRARANEGDVATVPMKRSSVSQIYELKRGMTHGVLEGTDWAMDGRWLGVGTRNRTIHIFAVNPYGGKTDLRSHLEGRVRNVDIVEAQGTSLGSIARLRGSKGTSNGDIARTPLAFTFVSTAELATSPSLLPPMSSPPLSHSPSISPSRGKRGTNYQHVLMFDPEDGTLSLHRLTLDKKAARESGISGVAASVQALGVTSISLPGMGPSGRLSSSPSNKAVPIRGKSTEHPLELGLKETRVVATYNLRRDRDWKNLSKSLKVEPKTQRVSGGDWLAEAELSSCSTSQRVVPRSIYLSHQFLFHTLGEDYHALIRSYQFHIVGSKIDVRKAVEISAYTSSAASDNGTFIAGFSAPRDIHRSPSSFDEPIASAISGSFDSSNIPPILPMYPNGIPGSNPKSLRQSIPIRAMAGFGDGVSEGLGRIRREMHRVRSPQLNPHFDSAMSASVPLEFDEEDEDFLNTNVTDQLSSSHEIASGAPASLLAIPGNTNTHQLMEADVIGTVDEDMLLDGWDRTAGHAIDDSEQFHDLTTAGYLVEEQDRQQHGLPALSSPGPTKKGKKRRGH